MRRPRPRRRLSAPRCRGTVARPRPRRRQSNLSAVAQPRPHRRQSNLNLSLPHRSGLLNADVPPGQIGLYRRAGPTRAPRSQGTVKLVFQPAEEGHAGGYHVLKEGVLDDVQAIFAVHVDTALPVGTVGSRPGPFLAGSARFTATITGKGGHAAGPQHVVDPIVAASSAVLSLQQLVARETDPLQGAVVSVTFIRGGEAFNVIPECVTLGGTCRSMTTEGLSYLMKRIQEVVEGQAAVGRCTAAVDFMEEKMRPYPATVNDKAVYGHARAVAESMIGEGNVRLCPQFMAAEDFGFYSQRIPAAFFSVGASNIETGKIHHVHSPHLDIDEAALPIGAALHAAVAIEYLNKQASAPRPCRS